MIASNIFRAIGDFCTNVLFKFMYDPFRFMDGWWASNIVNIIIFTLSSIALFYWLGQMAKYRKEAKTL